MKRQYGFLAALLAGLLAGGCGQKGPLFLPDDPGRSRTELPRMDRQALEEALGTKTDPEDAAPGGEPEDDEKRPREVPEAVPPEHGDDEAEPFIDPASPPTAHNDR